MQEKRIAMWSVPRSMSTVLLQAWSSRPDTVVFDEPLIWAYIAIKGQDFGMTVADLDPRNRRYLDWRFVVNELTAPLPPGKTIGYQKHQAHNLLPEVMGIEWILPFTNCFLIRQPKDVLWSLHKVEPEFTFEQTGWRELKQLFDYLQQATGSIPPVLDAYDLLNDPPRMLARLCAAVGVEFTDAMLSWPAMEGELSGKIADWYGAVASSTHFRPYQPKSEPFPAHLVEIEQRCNEIYQALYAVRLR